MTFNLVDKISFIGSISVSAAVTIRIGDCLDLIENEEHLYDAVIMDPPYEVGLHKKTWDATGISFSPELWTRLLRVLKPGGYVAAFAASRRYHRLASVAEDTGFVVYPFLAWKSSGGLPKPTNVSELFDRENVAERPIIGYRSGSGFTLANVRHGAQNRSTTRFPIYARHISAEAQRWRGFYYGVNCLKPALEPILLVQKPINGRAIDNLRKYGTGALNLGSLEQRYGGWPSTILEHPKARKAEHGSAHPSPKPLALMQDLCLLLCPPGGTILDPFAGTGTTGVAARSCGFASVLIEQDAAMEAVIRRRLA